MENIKRLAEVFNQLMLWNTRVSMDNAEYENIRSILNSRENRMISVKAINELNGLVEEVTELNALIDEEFNRGIDAALDEINRMIDYQNQLGIREGDMEDVKKCIINHRRKDV